MTLLMLQTSQEALNSTQQSAWFKFCGH